MYLAVRGEGGTEHQQDVQVKVDTYITLSQSEHQDLDSCSVQKDVCSSELNVLKVQLRQAEETAQKVQREVRVGPRVFVSDDRMRVRDVSGGRPCSQVRLSLSSSVSLSVTG